MLINRRQGFTLMEILIVAALITVLSSIAIISVNSFYNQAVKKTTIGELNRVGMALAFAEQDIGFYPKLAYLDKSEHYVLYDLAGDRTDPNMLVNHFDTYGFLAGGLGDPLQSRVASQWKGPYIGVSETRAKSGRGQGGVVKVRLSDVAELFPDERSVVDWPADPLGNPYVFYRLKAVVDSSGNITPVFVSSPGARADFFNAVVSYGANRIPGGNDNTPLDSTLADQLRAGGLYSKVGGPGGVSDPYFSGTGNPAVFIMKSAHPSVRTEFRIETDFSGPNYAAFLDAFKVAPALYDPLNGVVGTLDFGTDDLVYRF